MSQPTVESGSRAKRSCLGTIVVPAALALLGIICLVSVPGLPREERFLRLSVTISGIIMIGLAVGLVFLVRYVRPLMRILLGLLAIPVGAGAIVYAVINLVQSEAPRGIAMGVWGVFHAGLIAGGLALFGWGAVIVIQAFSRRKREDV